MSLVVVLRPIAFVSLMLCSVFAQAQLRVLTTIAPLQLIAQAVAGEQAQVDVLLPPGSDPHHFSLRPSDMRKVQGADLLYWVGPDMEGFMPKVLQSRSQPSVAVQELAGLHLRRFGDDHHDHDHDHDHDHEAHAGHADGHDHAHRPGSIDAHLWLLPANAQVIAARIAADLAQADPEHAEQYQTNLQAFETRLNTLDSELKTRLAPLASKPYFVFHQAFDYFEQAYGLKHQGVFSVSSEVQPGAKQVAAMREQLQAAGATCVFTEPPLRPRLAQTLSQGLPVQLAELDPLGSQAQSYEQLLSNLADSLADCLEQI